MKDVEITQVFRNDLGEVVKIEVLADYHIDFSFVKRNGKISQVSSGPVTPAIYRKMRKQVWAIFNYTNIASQKPLKKDQQLSFMF